MLDAPVQIFFKLLGHTRRLQGDCGLLLKLSKPFLEHWGLCRFSSGMILKCGIEKAINELSFHVIKLKIAWKLMKWEHGKVGADCPPIVNFLNFGGL